MTRRVASYVSGMSDIPLLGCTIGEMFDQIVAQYPDQEALIVRHQELRYTYRQLQVEVDRCARGLMALGLQKGERIGIWSPNRAEWTITQFATSKIGAILVNINPSYRVHELEYALQQSGCATLMMAPHFRTSNYTEMLLRWLPELRASPPNQLGEVARPADGHQAGRRACGGHVHLGRCPGDGRRQPRSPRRAPMAAAIR